MIAATFALSGRGSASGWCLVLGAWCLAAELRSRSLPLTSGRGGSSASGRSYDPSFVGVRQGWLDHLDGQRFVQMLGPLAINDRDDATPLTLWSPPGFVVDKRQGTRFNGSKLEPPLADIHERFAGLTIKQLRYGDFIRNYDRTGMLLYLAPPPFRAARRIMVRTYSAAETSISSRRSTSASRATWCCRSTTRPACTPRLPLTI